MAVSEVVRARKKYFWYYILYTEVQFSSVTLLHPTLCNPMDCSTPGLPIYHQLPEFTQNHIHWVGDAIQPSHPLSSPSPLTLNLSQHQDVFKWVLHTGFSRGRSGGLVIPSFQNFPQFIVIHTAIGFGIVNKAEIHVFLELSCFFCDPVDVGNLISGSSAFSKTSLNI